MPKLPEAPDKKRATHAQRKGTVLARERIPFSFSSDRSNENTQNLSCRWWKAHVSVFIRRAG